MRTLFYSLQIIAKVQYRIIKLKITKPQKKFGDDYSPEDKLDVWIEGCIVGTTHWDWVKSVLVWQRKSV